MGKLYLIGNSHIDPVWLWNWQSGYSEVLATFRSALDRMKEFPEFKYTCACAVYYQWVEKTDPEMFEEIRERVREGRWNIVGGWFLQPDCNIPSGESFARHALYSQRYFKDRFGIIAKTGYNVDSFGHNAALPKLLRASGMSNYVFMRPGKREKDLPSESFVWESDDGSRVDAFRIPIRYNIDLSSLKVLEKVYDEISGSPFGGMAFYGVGNHGGGPTVRLINGIKALGLENTVFATVDEYFDGEKHVTPTVRGELQHHARGCYSANTLIKRNNLKCEENILTAERFSVLAGKLVGYKYPEKAIKKAWKDLMFDQFHDILAGCAIKSAYDDASYLHGEIMSITEQIINGALQAITRKIDIGAPSSEMCKDCSFAQWSHDVLGAPFVVFNPHAFRVKQEVSVQFELGRMTDESGREVPIQKKRAEFTDGRRKYISSFIADVEPFGYRVYYAFDTKSSDIGDGVRVCEHYIENAFVKVVFDRESGEPVSITDKRRGVTECFSGFGAVLLDETECDTWAHDRYELGSVCGAFAGAEFEVLSEGAVFGELKVISHCGNAELVRIYKLNADSSDIYVDATVRNVERHRAFKLCFPAKDNVICQVPCGTVTRPLCTGEEPFSNWLASGGLAVIGNGTYGYDSTEDQIRVTVMRTCAYADHFAERDGRMDYMEEAPYRFDYVISRYVSRSDTAQKAQAKLSPLRAVNAGFHAGVLGRRYCGLSLRGEGLIVSAIKKAEDGEGNVIRFFEYEGKETDAEITLCGSSFASKVKPYSINTLKDDGSAVNILEWETED